MNQAAIPSDPQERVAVPMGLRLLAGLSATLLGLFAGLICFAALNRSIDILGVIDELFGGIGAVSPALVAVYGVVSLVVGGFLAFKVFQGDLRSLSSLRRPASKSTLQEGIKILLLLALLAGLFWTGNWLGEVNEIMEEVSYGGFEEEGGLFGWVLSALLIILPGLGIFALLQLPPKVRNLIFLIFLLGVVISGLVYLILFDLPTLISVVAICIPAGVIALYKASINRTIRWIALALIVLPVLGLMVLNIGALIGLTRALLDGAFSILLIAVPAVCIALVVIFREKLALKLGMLLLTVVVLIGMMVLIDTILKASDANASVLADFKEAAGIFWPIYVSIPIALPIGIVVGLLTRVDRSQLSARKGVRA